MVLSVVPEGNGGAGWQGGSAGRAGDAEGSVLAPDCATDGAGAVSASSRGMGASAAVVCGASVGAPCGGLAVVSSSSTSPRNLALAILASEAAGIDVD